MTPVQSWSPADYFRASRAARRAWTRTSQQLEFGLEDAGAPDGERADVTSAAAPASSSPTSGLDADVAQNTFSRTGMGDIASGDRPYTDSDPGRGGSEPPSASSPPSPSEIPEGGLAVPAEEAGVHPPPPTTERVARISVSSASAGLNQAAPVAGLPQDLRDRSQEGA